MKQFPSSVIVATFVVLATIGVGAYAGPHADSAECGCDQAGQGHALFARGKSDSAIVAYRKAVRIYLQRQDWNCVVHSFNGMAHGWIQLNQFDSARTALREARVTGNAHRGVDSLEIAETLSLLAYVSAFQETQLDSAIGYGLTSLKIREAKKGPFDELDSKSCYTLAYVYKKKGEFRAALQLLERSYNIQEHDSSIDSYSISSTLLALGNVYDNLEDYGRAQKSYALAIEKLEGSGLGNSPTAATCHELLSWCYWHMGEIRKAWDEGEKAIDLCKRSVGENSVFTGSCYGELGEIAADEGDLDRAEELCRRSLSILRESGGEKGSAVPILLRTLGVIERRRGNLAEARRLCLESLKLAEKISGENHPDLADYHEELALTLAALGERTKAISQVNESIRIIRRSDKVSLSLSLARVLMELSQMWHDVGRNDLALKSANEAMNIEELAGRDNSLLYGRTLNLIGKLLLARGENSPGLDSYTSALSSLWPEYSDSLIRSGVASLSPSRGEAVIAVLVSRAEALNRIAMSSRQNLKYQGAALNAYEQATALAGSIRRTYRLEGSKLAYAGSSAPIIDAGVELALHLYQATGMREYAERAFRLEEESKAGILYEAIRRSSAERFAGVPDSLVEKERRLATDAGGCELQLERAIMKPNRDPRNEERLRRKLFEFRESLIRVQQDCERTYPRFAQLLGNYEPPTIAQIQEKLDANTALIEYGMSRRNIWTFVVTRGSFDVISGPLTSDFKGKVADFLRAAKTLDWDRFADLSHEIARVLMDPIGRQVSDVRHLVIIPDDILHFIPFESLVMTSPRKINGHIDYSRLNYLVETKEVSYSNSARLFVRQFEADRSESNQARSFAGFAPVFKDSIPKSAARPLLAGNLRSINLDGHEFGELSSSENEVRDIADGFERSGGTAIALCNNEATKARFLQIAPEYRYLHIATHCFIDDDRPGLSGLIFSPPPGSKNVEDEALYTAETYNLSLRSDLLVLSGCETGIGKYQKGEGLLTLTRGFSYAGAHNIVFSLWRVTDENTSRFMVSFYRHFLGGESYEGALRSAKLEMIRVKPTSFPFNWAAFVLMRN